MYIYTYILYMVYLLYAYNVCPYYYTRIYLYSIHVELLTLPAVTIYDDAPPQHHGGPPRSSLLLYQHHWPVFVSFTYIFSFLIFLLLLCFLSPLSISLSHQCLFFRLVWTMRNRQHDEIIMMILLLLFSSPSSPNETVYSSV
jgi:hypothetical protein